MQRVLTPVMVRSRYCRGNELEGVRFPRRIRVYDMRMTDDEYDAIPPAPWGERLYAGSMVEYAEGLRAGWFADPRQWGPSMQWYWDARDPHNRARLQERLRDLRKDARKDPHAVAIYVANFGAGIIRRVPTEPGQDIRA